MEKFTLQQLEQADEFDIVEYPEFLEGEELKKCYAKYGKYYKQIINEWTEKTQQRRPLKLGGSETVQMEVMHLGYGINGRLL